ncbi:hypothetical protein SAMN05216296_0791 [Pseudomonas pohangensis]|uniref:Uncharacterized protein n=1 Tax=Pseudomonas pohangensis TaxID=364197 RepID=A0A1H2EHE0_9PSED|nr:hypothetical protein [Pseudomonas pohangensis]SDT94582.1 hypothetical protein SAMN05216296_0791 [Pseudomonas pohangensis]
MSGKTLKKNLAQRRFPTEIVHRQRIAFISLSLVLIIYALAGGNIEPEGTFMYLPIKFSRPYFLLFAAWGIWLYFLYRYWLVADSPWKAFSEEVRLRTHDDRRIRPMCLAALQRFDISDELRKACLNHLNDGWVFSIVKLDGSYHFDPSHLYRPQTQAPTAGGSQSDFFPLNRSETRTYQLALLPATFKAITLEATFSDEVLPSLLMWITPTTWLLAYCIFSK